MVKNYHVLSFSFAQLTNPLCSKLSFLSFYFDLESFVIAHVQNLFLTSSWMLCVYKGNDKKSLQTWILKKSDMKPHLFSSLTNSQWWLFFCLFEIETWKPVYPMMLKCNVCIAQCLLVGYYKSSDQSNKVDPFSTTEKCVGVPSIKLTNTVF